MGVAMADLERGVSTIAQLAREQASEVDSERRLTDDIVGAIRESGFNRVLLPEKLGGAAIPPRDMVALIASVAAADGSVGWCTTVGAGSKFFAGYVSEDVAGTIWTDPDEANAGAFGPMGTAVATGTDSRYRVTGRWPFASNCLHSSWLGLGAWFKDGVDAEPEPAPRVVFVPRDEIEIHDTWDVIGLRGTGSHDASLTDFEIDRDHTCAFHEPTWPDEPLWRLPLFTVLIPGLTAVCLGIARGAIDEILRQAASGRSGFRGPLREDSVVMADVATADATLRGAHAGLDVALDEAWELAVDGDPVDQRLQARVLMACSHACETAVKATDVAHRLGGGAAAYAPSPLLRALRDVQTARQHIAFHHGNRTMFGRAIAGEAVFAPPYIV